MMQTGFKLNAAVLAAALWCGASPAVAATQVELTGYQFMPTGVSGGLDIVSRKSNTTFDAGEYLSTFENLQTSTTSQIASFGLNALISYNVGAPYAIVPVGKVFSSPLRDEELAALVDHAQGPLTSIQAAAFEIAILAVVNNQIGADFSLTNGGLRLSGDFLTDGVETDAQQYLNNIDGTGASVWTGSASDVEVLFSTGKPASDYQIFYTGSGTTTSVPEPASWLSMLVGFSMLGIAARGRRYFASRRLTA